MGTAQVAVATDATAGYWNPASLINLQTPYDVSLMHAEYFGGVAAYDFAGFALAMDSLSSAGLSLIRFGVDDIPDTRYLYDANGAINYDNIRFFSAADYGFLFSYARKIPVIEGLSLGGNLKVIYRKAGDFAQAWGFGLDAAALLQRDKWKFGLMARDVSGTFNAWTHSRHLLDDVYQRTGNTLPENAVELTLPQAILGVARHIVDRETWGLSAATDWRMTFDGKRNVLLKSRVLSIDPAFGMEFEYKEKLFVRSGVSRFQQLTLPGGQTQYTVAPDFGMGVAFGIVRIDYALTNLAGFSDSLYSHIFSLNIKLNEELLRGEK